MLHDRFFIASCCINGKQNIASMTVDIMDVVEICDVTGNVVENSQQVYTFYGVTENAQLEKDKVGKINRDGKMTV